MSSFYRPPVFRFALGVLALVGASSVVAQNSVNSSAPPVRIELKGISQGYAGSGSREVDMMRLRAIMQNPQQPCWDEAAAYHGVDPWLLYSIAHVESRHNPKAINRANNNGTVDYGMMQINSIWIPTLEKHGIPKTMLHNACASTFIGAWVLSNNFKKFGNSWKAIAAYNVGNPDSSKRRYEIGYNYAKKVYAAHARFTQERLVGVR